MLQQTQATIFPADERICLQKSWYRQHHTIGIGRDPVGDLIVCSEVTLKQGTALPALAERDGCVMLLPIVGDVAFATADGTRGGASPGEVVSFFVPAGFSYEVANPYQASLISYLHWVIAPADRGDLRKTIFGTHMQHNVWSYVASGEGQAGWSVCIARLSARSEACFVRKCTEKTIFVYVVDGVAEVQNRLLLSYDALALKDMDVIELEALSSEAVVLVLEV